MAAPLTFDTATNAKLTISTTVVNFADYFNSLGENAQITSKANTWSIFVESGGLRIFENGNTPSTTVGTPVAAGQFYPINGASASDINLIRDAGGVDAVIWVASGIAVAGFTEAVRFGKVTLETGDLEIGAVEIKDGTTDQRATVNASGELLVAAAASTSAIQAKGTDATGTDAYATVVTSVAAASHIMIVLQGSNDAIVSIDAGTTDSIPVPAGSIVVLDNVTIAATTAIQAKNASAGNNYTNLDLTIW